MLGMIISRAVLLREVPDVRQPRVTREVREDSKDPNTSSMPGSGLSVLPGMYAFGRPRGSRNGGGGREVL